MLGVLCTRYGHCGDFVCIGDISICVVIALMWRAGQTRLAHNHQAGRPISDTDSGKTENQTPPSTTSRPTNPIHSTSATPAVNGNKNVKEAG